MSDHSPRQAGFPTTRWTSVIRPIDLDNAGAIVAWEQLCADYWPPVYSYLRRSGLAVHDAEDLTQEFFQHLFVRELPKQADRGRGRFRNFLLTALKFFLANQHQKRIAQKRGGGKRVLSLDDAELQFGLLPDLAAVDPGKAFQIQFLHRFLERVCFAQREEYRQRGEEELFEALNEMGPHGLSTKDVGQKFEMSCDVVSSRKYRMKLRWWELARAELEQMVPDGEIEEELRFLRSLAES